MQNAWRAPAKRLFWEQEDGTAATLSRATANDDVKR